MRGKVIILWGGLVVSGLVLSGCRMSPEQTKLQYMPDMADAPTVKTHEDYLDPPEGAIPMGQPIYPKDVLAANDLVMPARIANDEATIAQGKNFYEIFCVPCHGAGGKGDGTLGDQFPKPPDLTLDHYRGQKDGFFFYRITFGGPIMPGYGHAISVEERWQIVAYLRALQTGAH